MNSKSEGPLCACRPTGKLRVLFDKINQLSVVHRVDLLRNLLVLKCGTEEWSAERQFHCEVRTRKCLSFLVMLSCRRNFIVYNYFSLSLIYTFVNRSIYRSELTNHPKEHKQVDLTFVAYGDENPTFCCSVQSESVVILKFLLDIFHSLIVVYFWLQFGCFWGEKASRTNFKILSWSFYLLFV